MATYQEYDGVNNGGTLTISAGSNRFAILFLSYNTTTDPTLTGLTWGALDLFANRYLTTVVRGSSEYCRIYAFYLTEADIATYSGSALTGTYSDGTGTNRNYRVVTFNSYPEQTVPTVFASATGLDTAVSATISIPSGAAAAAAHCVFDRNGNNTDITWTNATERADSEISTVYRQSSATISASGSVTVTATITATTPTAEENALLIVALGSSGSVAPIVAYYSMQD